MTNQTKKIYELGSSESHLISNNQANQQVAKKKELIIYDAESLQMQILNLNRRVVDLETSIYNRRKVSLSNLDFLFIAIVFLLCVFVLIAAVGLNIDNVLDHLHYMINPKK